MLATKYRLVKDKNFKKVLTKGRSFFSPNLRMRYVANGLDFCRISVVASTKVSKKAVIRNRLKRQVREAIRLNFKKIKPGNDIVVYLKTQAIGQSYEQLEKEILANLSKSKLLK